jgi:hypothetical protein
MVYNFYNTFVKLRMIHNFNTEFSGQKFYFHLDNFILYFLFDLITDTYYDNYFYINFRT